MEGYYLLNPRQPKKIFHLRPLWLSRFINLVAASRPGVKDTSRLKRSSPFLLDASPARLPLARAARKAKLALKVIGFGRHLTSMEEQFKGARRLIESEVLYCQTYLVEHLIKEGDIDFWEIMRNGQQATPEVFEWWLVTESFANMLADEGEVIVNKYNCHWWGRTTTGQAIYMDGVIEDIVATYYYEPNDNPTRPGARG